MRINEVDTSAWEILLNNKLVIPIQRRYDRYVKTTNNFQDCANYRKELSLKIYYKAMYISDKMEPIKHKFPDTYSKISQIESFFYHNCL